MAVSPTEPPALESREGLKREHASAIDIHAPSDPDWHQRGVVGVLRAIAGFVSTCVLALAAVLLVVFILTNVIFGYEVAIEKSDSQAPMFHAGDIIIQKRIPVAEAKVDDIITFKEPKTRRLLTHRLLVMVPRRLDPKDPKSPIFKYEMRTKGDASGDWDVPWSIRANGEVGRYIVSLPKAGYALKFIQQPLFLGMAGAIFLMAVVWLFYLWFRPAEPEELARARARETQIDSR